MNGLVLTLGAFLTFSAFAEDDIRRVVQAVSGKTPVAAFEQVLEMDIPCEGEEVTIYDRDGYHPIDSESRYECDASEVGAKVRRFLARKEVLRILPADARSRQVMAGQELNEVVRSVRIRVRALYLDPR